MSSGYFCVLRSAWASQLGNKKLSAGGSRGLVIGILEEVIIAVGYQVLIFVGCILSSKQQNTRFFNFTSVGAQKSDILDRPEGEQLEYQQHFLEKLNS